MRAIVPLVLALLAAAPSAAETLSVFRRAEPLEVRTGVVSIRTVFDMPLDHPVECDDGTLACRETGLFNRVWRLDFETETQSVEEGARLERAGRGTVLLALRADAEEGERFDEELRRVLGALPPEAFHQPFAGRNPRSAPFAGMAEATAPGRSWACFLFEQQGSLTRYYRKTERDPDGRVVATGSGTGSYGLDEQNRVVCDQAAQVTEAAWPEVIRTMPAPATHRETTIRLEVVDRLPRELRVDETLRLPPGLALSVGDAPPGVLSSESTNTSGGTARSKVVIDGREWEGTARPLRIDPRYLDRAWLARWAIERVEHRHGATPDDLRLETETLHVALIPTASPTPARAGSLAPTVGPAAPALTPDVELESLTAVVAARLGEAATLDLETLESAITGRPAGLDETGWLLTVCRQDGSAEFWLAPTKASAAITNADRFCGELETRVER